MKHAIFTATLVATLIALALIILGAGTAMWLTAKVVHAAWIVLCMLVKHVLSPVSTLILTPCR